MSAKPASTESQECLSFLNFNSFYNELQNEVLPVFIDQNTGQIDTQPGDGCTCFQCPFVNTFCSLYSHANRNPTKQLSHPDGLSLLASGTGAPAGHAPEGAVQNKVKVTRKVSDSLIVTVKQLLFFRFRCSKYKPSCSGCI